MPTIGRPTADDREPIVGDPTRRNALFSFAAQMSTATGTAVLTLYLVRALHPRGYGTFALAVAVGSLASVAADMGLISSASRYIAENRSDRARVRAVFGDALRLKLALAGAIAAVLIVAAGPIASLYGAPSLIWPLRVIALAMLGQTTMAFASGTFIALRRVKQNLWLVAAESLVEMVASIVLVLVGLGATGAALGRTVAYVFAGALGLVLVARLIGRPALRASALSRSLIGYAGALVLLDAAFTLFNQVDVFVIGAYLTTSAVGAFQAPIRLIAFLAYPGLALAAAVAPRFARTGESTSGSAALTKAVRLLLIGHVAVAAIVLVWATPIARILLAGGYSQSAGVLRALTPYILLAGVAPLISLTINYLGFARRRVPIAVGTVLVNLVIDLILVPRIGVVGGAIGTDVAYVGYVVGHFWIGRAGADLPLRPLLVSAARCLLAGAVLAGSLVLWGTRSVPLPLLFLGGACGLALYAIALLVTREVRPAELAGAWRTVASALPAARSRRRA